MLQSEVLSGYYSSIFGWILLFISKALKV